LWRNGIREFPKFTQIPYSIPQVIILGDSRPQANLDNFISPDSGPSDIINKQVVKDLIVKFMRKLSPIDQAILLCRYGFLDGENKKLKYVAKIFKFSSEYIRVKEMLAIRRLRFLLGCSNSKNKHQKNILKELTYSL